MKKHSKLIVTFLLTALLGSMCMFSVFAEGEETGGGSQVVVDPGTGGGNEDPGTGGGGSEDPGTGSGGSEDPGTGGGGSEDPGTGSGGNDEPIYVDPGQSSGGGSYNPIDWGYSGGNNENGSYNYTDNYSGWSDLYSSNEGEFYIGGDQTYEPPASTAPSAPLYKTDVNNLDVGTLSNNDWNDIKAKLANAGSYDDTDDGTGDFAFIQKNNSKNDNGHLIIIVGVACVLLSIVGFIYVIASSVSNRSKLKANIGYSGSQFAKTTSRYSSNAGYTDNYRMSENNSEPKPKKKTKGGTRYR